MKINFHNRLDIKCGEFKHSYFNMMFENVLNKIASFESYNNFIAVGCGVPNNNENTQKLSNFIKKYAISTSILQNNIVNGNLFVKKTLVINELDLCNENITELGFCEDLDDNPTIFNYFSLVSEESPNGIVKSKGEKLQIDIYIFVEITSSSDACLCEGNNPLISLILGEGMNGKIYAKIGDNLLDNISTFRENPRTEVQYEMTNNFIVENEVLHFNFEAILESQTCREIVLVSDERAIARINLLEFDSAENVVQNFHSKNNYCIDLGDDVKEIVSVKNLSNNLFESDFNFKKFASVLGDKHTLPNEFIFNNQTPRFVSKDSKMIFFVLNDYVYGFQDFNGRIKQLNTGNLYLQNILKIVSFEDCVFVVSKTEPYLTAFKIESNKLNKVDLDFEDFLYYENIGDAYDIDITMSKNGTYMLSMILENKKGVTAYFYFDDLNSKFSFDDYILSDYEFSYLIAIFKNNYVDCSVLFLKEDEFSYNCRIVTHYADQTYRDVATVLAYDYTHNTKQIYSKDHAIIVEKTTSPKIYIYYYPEARIFNLPLIDDELDDYFSGDMLYLIQKYDNNYKIFNIVGYNEPEEFDESFDLEIDKSKILTFEFFEDFLMIFLDDDSEPIRVYDFVRNKTCIENLSQADCDYEVTYKKYKIVGSDGKDIKINFKVDISL